MQHLEEQIAHLTRTVEELNTVVTRQQSEIDRLTRRVEMLLQREAERRRKAQAGSSSETNDRRIIDGSLTQSRLHGVVDHAAKQGILVCGASFPTARL